MILAGDVGATKTRVGLFDAQFPRPHLLVARTYRTAEFPGLREVLAAFLDEERIEGRSPRAACFGVAGPVLGQTATLTNAPFVIDASALAHEYAIPRVTLLNDVEAMALSIPVLEPGEVHVLQAGQVEHGGNVVLIAAGTGLGAAMLHQVGGRRIASPTEAGHADWTVRTVRDINVLRWLTREYGRAEVEQVLSGRGLRTLHRLMHSGSCAAEIEPDGQDAPAAISNAGLEQRCSQCIEALEIFVEAYGAEAGNAALRTVATGGVFIGGGIAPQILPALTNGRFMQAFCDKGQMHELLARMPVRVIVNADAGLIGAAVSAVEMP